ncbi:ErmE/ErmH/ErmO/ErmR family 23S rRNA (adenine(2058)-N(6))-methyltransferase [Streptomyces litchfieldiae]|uniref:ErmE/ErmH/ErmO/ErmR family 23S rRNA (Adenine(2058)-N(6))-methyltransferase n=1 Tax=Streptomyces litchfieldiae TaxID=3075543 RepID=A0ABU2MML6_9ACTN|nr:ErmE/ErmH/ErmO/ErmR family 23S rRNA (adenine(2058)-N(6))-methyltransferase [Streptomyces sp. DSM 44938]MDT0342613.1 ErmE/ErmH/ErmO/ErmR family 23S rRNA (adenine(2058)-N(6))-methyltransferase [Streptomyces sp. DSM 44938]
MAHRRKTLSQNFLYDTAALRQIVRTAELRPSDLVVEPGAGEGTLTRVLARTARQVIAYELDPALAARLPRRMRAERNVRVIHADFLTAHPPRTPFAVVGNVPYSRTTDIVRWCLAARELTSATLVTQLEFARRRTGDFGTWPLLTVTSWPEHAWHLGPRLRRQLFTPVPRTDSAVLHITRRPAPLLPRRDLGAFRALVTEGFTGAGGSLRATLARHHRTSRVREALRAARVPDDAPVGFVSPDQWLTVFRHLHRGRSPVS